MVALVMRLGPLNVILYDNSTSMVSLVMRPRPMNLSEINTKHRRSHEGTLFNQVVVTALQKMIVLVFMNLVASDLVH